MLSTRPSKHLSKRSISNEDSDTPTSCVSPPPTKQEKTSSRLSKQSESIKQHQKSPVKDSADPLLSVSKLPTRGQRSSDKLKSRKPQHSPTDNSDRSKKDSHQNTETPAKTSESTVASRVKDKSVSTKEEDKQSNANEITLKAKETNKLDSITSSTSVDISKIQSVLNSDVDEVARMADSLNSNEISKAIPGQSPVAHDNNAEPNIQERQHEGEQQAKLNSSSHTQSNTTTQEQQTLLQTENSPEEVDFSEATQLIPDLLQEKKTYPSVLAQDTAPGNKDVNDMSDKPVVGDNIHSDTMKNFDEEGVMPNNVSLKATMKFTSKEEATRNRVPAKFASKDQDAEPKHVLSATSIGISVDTNLANTEQQKQKEKGQATNIILANDTLPSTLSIDSVKSKEDVGRKLQEALDIQTETVTVCKLPKNFENQQNKEPLLLAGEFERQKKDSKPTQKLNDAAVESSGKHSQSSCKEELKGITTEDEAEEDVTKQEKPSDLSLEEKSFHSDSDNGPQTVVTDVLEEKSTEAEQATNETIATVADKKHECEILLKEKNASKETKQPEQTIKASAVKNKWLLTKDDKVKEDNTNEEDKKVDDVKEMQIPEIKATGTQMDTKGNKKEKSSPNKTAQSEVRNQEDKKDFVTRDQLEDPIKTEENGNRLADSKYPIANLEQKPETHEASEKALKTHILQMDTIHKLTKSTKSEGNTEANNSSTQSLVNEAVVVNAETKISIQQDQCSIFIGDVGLIKPDENKLTESKCPNNKLEQEPERGRTKVQEKTTQSQKTDTTQDLSSLSTIIEGTREKTDIKDSSLSCEKTGVEAAYSVSKEQESVTVQEPDTIRTKALEKAKENQIEKTSTIKELNLVSTSAKGTTEKTPSKDSSVNSLNGAPTAIANSEVSNQHVQKPILSGEQAQNITKPDKNKSTGPKSPHNELEEEPEGVRTKVQEKTTGSQKHGTAQKPNTLSILTKDSTLKRNQEESTTGEDHVKDVEKEEKNKTKLKHPNSNLQQESELVRTKALEKTSDDQDEKLDSFISTSAKVTKDETLSDETKDSSEKCLNLTPAATTNSQVSNQEVQVSVTIGDQDGDITKLEKKRSTGSNFRCPNTDLKQETETVRKEKKSEILKTAISNANCEVSAQKDQKPSTVTDEHEEIKKPEENIGQTTDSKASNANQEHEPKSVIKESKLSDKSGVSTTEKVASMSDTLHKKQNTVNECVQTQNEDQKISTAKIYVKQESDHILGKDASSTKVSGEQTDKFSSVVDEKAISTNYQKSGEATKEKIKTDSDSKQELQILRRETILNVSDPQKPTKATVNVSSSLPATVKPFQGVKIESPSSWLDLEHKQKQKKQHKKRLNSSASEDESVELDDFDDFIRSIKEGGAPFALPPKRHFRKKSSSPSPHFAMPAIKEDHFEKTFDPEEFKFGLSKNGKSFRDPSPAMVIKQKAANRERRTLGKGAEDNALPTPEGQMKSLDEVDRADGVKEGTEARKEESQNNGEEPGKLTSRLERMSILSSLLSSPRTSRKTKEETTSASNSKLSSNQQQDLRSLGKQGAVDSPLPSVGVDKEGVKSIHEGPLVGGGIGKVSESALSPSSPPALPAFSEIKLPDHLEKYLKKNTEESEASQDSAQMTKTKLNPEGSALMDHLSITGAINVDAGLPLTTKYNQQKPQNGISTTKTKVGL